MAVGPYGESRGVVSGYDEDNGEWRNIGVSKTTAGSHSHDMLMITEAGHPSDLSGRDRVVVVIDSITSELLYTVPPSKVFNVTDMILSVQNSSTSTHGIYYLRDGILITDTINFGTLIAEAPTSETAVINLQHSFVEPLHFTGGVYGEENQGVLHVIGTLMGYLEDV